MDNGEHGAVHCLVVRHVMTQAKNIGDGNATILRHMVEGLIAPELKAQSLHPATIIAVRVRECQIQTSYFKIFLYNPDNKHLYN